MHTQPIGYLKRRDKTLARIIREVGPCTLAPRKDYFAALCEAVISQQLSTQAAATIHTRFRGLFPRKRPTPQRLLALTDADLRAVGLSRQKIAYTRDLAQKFSDRTVPARRLASMNDQAIIDALVQVKGVGLWTVQMFLIFVLNRPDILPVDDLGLRKAVQRHYGLNDLPAADEIVERAKPWVPYRSIATWYLWQGLNNQPLDAERPRHGPRAPNGPLRPRR